MASRTTILLMRPVRTDDDMFRMEKTVISQTTEKVMARVDVSAIDRRTQEKVEMIIFCELTEKEQNVKPIVERALENLGYLYYGISNVDTTSVPFDAEGMYLTGKEKEQEDLNRK